MTRLNSLCLECFIMYKMVLEILEEMKDFSNQDFSTHFTQYSSHSKENWPFVPYKDTLESP